MYLSVFLLGFIFSGTLRACFLDLVDYFFSHVREVLCLKILSSAIISSNIFSSLVYLFSSSGTPIIRTLAHLMLSQWSPKLSSFLLILFSIFCFMAMISTILSSRSLIHSSASVILLLIPSSVLFLSVFISSRALVNSCHIFSILFLKSWIIFTIIILNSFSGRLPISTSFSYFSGDLSCSFIWDIILFLLILVSFL